jgi:hypothetical protein
MMQHTQRPNVPREIKTDVFQYDQKTGRLFKDDKPQSTTSANEAITTIQKWAAVPYKLFERSEPFIIQATLVGVVQTGLSCSATNIFKSLFLLVPPGMARFAPTNPFPPTFFDEYQPILYPKLESGGLGGNIWAEMLCRFGYAGVAVFGVLLILALVGMQRLLRVASPTLSAPIAFGGAIVAFYIQRNDLHFTLQMLKWVALVVLAAYLLSVTAGRIRRWTCSRDELN